MFTVKNISFFMRQFQNKVFEVKNVSFEVSAGQTLALLGESGSGKTLTALATIGLLPKQAEKIEGEIWLEGSRFFVGRQSSIGRLRGKKVTMIFQSPLSALNPVFTAGTQILDVIKTHAKLSNSEAIDRSMSLFENVGFSHPEKIYHAYPHQLSGGMAQRVMIAMALSCNPKLIIADEPTTALDVTTQIQILELIKDLQKQYNFGLLLISHDIGVVAEMANDIVIMHNGEIVEAGMKTAILENPKSEYTRSLLVNSCFHNFI